VTPRGKVVILKNDGSWHYKEQEHSATLQSQDGDRERLPHTRRAGVVGFPFGIEAENQDTWPCTRKAFVWEGGWTCHVANGAYQLTALDLKIERIKVFFQGDEPEGARVYRVTIHDVRRRPWLPAMETFQSVKELLDLKYMKKPEFRENRPQRRLSRGFSRDISDVAREERRTLYSLTWRRTWQIEGGIVGHPDGGYGVFVDYTHLPGLTQLESQEFDRLQERIDKVLRDL